MLEVVGGNQAMLLQYINERLDYTEPINLKVIYTYEETRLAIFWS